MKPESERGVDYAKAISFYEQAVQQNSIKACEGLARIYAACPDPQFHDGEKAVKFASFVVKKKPNDPEAHTLLAHGYLRNMQVSQAVRHGGLAIINSRPEAKSKREAALAGYTDGMPMPASATIEWVMEAAQKDVLWAKVKLAQVTANPKGSMYNPQLALKMCDEAVREGKSIMYITMGDVHLQEGDLEKAFGAYEKFYDSGFKLRLEYVPPQIRLRSALNRPVEAVFQEAVKAHKGYLEPVKVERQKYLEHRDKNGNIIRVRNSVLGMDLKKIPAEIDDALFLYRVAKAMGHPDAADSLAELRRELFAVPDVVIPEVRSQKRSPRKGFEPFLKLPD